MLRDLTGLSEVEANKEVLDELAIASIPAQRAYPDHQNPIKVSYIGVLLFAGYLIIFTRRARRWVARAQATTWDQNIQNQLNKALSSTNQNEVIHRYIKNGFLGAKNNEWRILTIQALCRFTQSAEAVWGWPASQPQKQIDLKRLRSKRLTNPRTEEPPTVKFSLASA